MSIIDDNKTNILDQISSYSQSNTENLIYKLKDEYQSQLKLNKILKEEEHEENIHKIKNFIEINSGEIDNQLQSLRNITNQIKIIVEENNSLRKIGNKYNEVLDSPDCVEFADKLREIKKIKDNINNFLDSSGIWKIN